MRDIAVLLIVFGSIPFIFRRPYIGILVWSWISYMNPQKLAWGFAQNFPVAAIVGIVTLVAVLTSGEKIKFPFNGVVATWMLFVFFMTVTTMFALYPADAWQQWDKVFKIQLFALLTLALINDRDRLRQLLWIIVVSLGFFGVKGGLYVLRTGGEFGLVWGPPGGFISGNNELALALVMTLPLMLYLRRWEQRTWVRHMLTLALGLTVVSILGSFSRGALLALLACGAFLALKSRQRGLIIAAAVVGAVVAVSVLPQTWWERMGTINTYEEDSSAMGRLDAWTLAIQVASARPLGAGFESFNAETYLKYGADFNRPQDAHSIYFEVLGEHGWMGLLLFLALFSSAWRLGSRVIRETSKAKDFEQERDLIRMLQVAVVGYAVGGAFLGLAYFDLPYHLVGMIVIISVLAKAKAAGGVAAHGRSGQLPSSRLVRRI